MRLDRSAERAGDIRAATHGRELVSTSVTRERLVTPADRVIALCRLEASYLLQFHRFIAPAKFLISMVLPNVGNALDVCHDESGR